MAKQNSSEVKDPIFDVLASISAKHGLGSAIVGNQTIPIARISSGSLALNKALGGGYGEGRIVELYGPESAGKTLLAITGAIQAQKKYPNKYVAIIDAEHALDTAFAEKLGLNLDMAIINQCDNGEQGFDILESLVESGRVSYAIVDSVAAMTPKAEIEADMDQNQMGLQARMMSKGLRKVNGTISKTGTVVVFINQLREKIGVVFGNPFVTPGGNALKFYASQRIEVTKSVGKDKGEDGIATSTIIKCKAVKNKLSAPYKTCEMENVFGVGIDPVSEIFSLAENYGLIKRAGSWFSYGETKLGQGAETVKALLRDNPELVEELQTKILDILND
jgi:recombination protein RecA